MSLSNDLITQFVKATTESKKSKGETTVYGTINGVDSDGRIFVKLDGSTELTPVTTTTDIAPDDRVTVMIKNHSAVVTGNITDPSAKDSVVTIIGDKVDEMYIEEFHTKIAKIEQLEADYVEIGGRLDANEASINTLTVNKLDADKAALTYATIDALKAVDAKIDSLDVGNLDAEIARIDKLETNYADIKTLMFGSASGSVIQSSFSNSVIAQVGNAQIKSAMIESVHADQIMAGTIYTNLIQLQSEKGNMVIADETIQITDDNGGVRVQIGKDWFDDYSVTVWDADGNLMFTSNGITEDAIKEAIIRNDMVSDTANISASKLDIGSLFTEINNSTNTIKSNRIYLDEKSQTLDVAFKSLESNVSDLGTKITSQGTQISTIQGQISTKVWQQDIDTAKNEMSTKYSSLEQSLNKFETTVSSTYATKSEVGGANMLCNTRKPVNATHWTRGNTVYDATLEETVFYLDNATTTETTAGTDRVKVEPGETYTVSAYVKRTANVKSIDFFFLSRKQNETSDFTIAQHQSNMVPAANAWTKLTWTFVMDSNAYEGYLRIDHNGSTDGASSKLYYTMVKMEKGSSATDWTPAPEDIATYGTVLSIGSRVSQTEDKVAVNISKLDAYNNRITNLEVDSEGLSVRLDKIEVGGRNLIAGTSSTETVLGTYPASGNSEGASFRTIAIPNKNEYVLSFDAKSTVAGDVIRCYFYSPNTTTKAKSSEGTTSNSTDGVITITLTDAWKRYWIKYTQDGNGTTTTKVLLVGRRMAGAGTGSVSIRAVKLEEGRVPTDWTPAPEDVDGDISAASKTATNYLKYSTSGLVVGDHTVNTLGNNVLIDSSSVKVRTGTTVNSVFGADLIELAKNNESATISMLKGAFKIYYDSDNSDGGFGIYGKTSSGQERLAFQAVNENDNLTLGWGGYAAKANSTNIYGHKIYLTTNDDIILNPGSGNIQMDGNLVLTNGKNIFGKNTSGAMRSMAILNASNQMVFGYGSYENSEGNVFYEGNIVSLVSKSDISITPGSGNAKINGNAVLANGKNLFGVNTGGTMRSLAILNASNQMMFGYGSYSNSEGSAYYDGNNVTMRSKKDITFQTPSETIMLKDNSGGTTYSAFFRPNSNAKCTLGAAANRWYAVYASNGTIQTSDAREKENIVSLGDIHSELFDMLKPVQYNFINGNGKICYGLISQELIESMESLGIGEHDLDLVHHDVFVDDNGEEQDTFGITYTNLIAMLIHEVQKLKTEIKYLKSA